ncbi:MAG: hypothetical protein JRI98_03600 [Deltaproteobacteria bacterium]|nr:hypothetical protein [Deltaproteobacteria bacterium]
MIEGKGLMTVLEAQPFPKLEGITWSAVVDELLEFRGPSRAGAAARWFGSAIGFLVDRREPTALDRPWADSFEQAGGQCAGPALEAWQERASNWRRALQSRGESQAGWTSALPSRTTSRQRRQ